MNKLTAFLYSIIYFAKLTPFHVEEAMKQADKAIAAGDNATRLDDTLFRLAESAANKLAPSNFPMESLSLSEIDSLMYNTQLKLNNYKSYLRMGCEPKDKLQNEYDFHLARYNRLNAEWSRREKLVFNDNPDGKYETSFDIIPPQGEGDSFKEPIQPQHDTH